MGPLGSATEAERLKPVRSPLFPLLCGVVVSLLVGQSSGVWFWLGSLGVGLATTAACLWVLARSRGSSDKRVACLFAVLGFLVGWPWLLFQSEQIPEDWHWLPARELDLEIEVERLFQVRIEGRAGGLGQVVKAPEVVRELQGHRVSFYLETNPEEDDWVPTKRFAGRGILSYLPATERDSGFDRYLLNQDVHLSFRRGAVLQIIDPGAAWARGLLHLRNRCRSLLMSGDGLGYGPVFAAMLLGERALLDPERERRFVESGTLHLFAISGLHVMAVAAAVAQVLSLLRIPAVPKGLLGLSIVLLYVLVTGYSPSAVRAFSMVLCYWVALMLRRQANPFAAWVNSALLVLLWDPRQLWLPGFQLSYGVVGGLITVAGLMQDRWRNHPDPVDWRPRSLRYRIQTLPKDLTNILKQLFTLSLCASLFSAPLIISYFELFSGGAVFLNMILVPLAGLVVATGCLSLAGGLFLGTWWAAFYNQAAWILLATMEGLIGLALRLDGYFHGRVWPWEPTGPLLTFGALLLAAGLREWARQGRVRPGFAITAPMALILGGIILGSVSS